MKYRKRTTLNFDNPKKNNENQNIHHINKLPNTQNHSHQSKPLQQHQNHIKLPSVKYSKPVHEHNYILNEIIGQGAFAKVRKAYRINDQMPCVIKCYQKIKLNTQQKKKTISQEIEILKNISHPNIIKIIDSYETNQTINIVMQHFSHQSLTNFAKQHQPLSEETLRKITKSITEALIYLHSHKISHRDLKPENILINSKEEIKIIDLGLAMMGDHSQMIVAGTPQFMCPQLVNKKKYNPYKTDIWAFGILLYWLVLGYYPQDNDKKRKSLNGISNFQLRFPVDIHPGIQYLIEKMLAINPDERINAQQILNDTWIKPRNIMLEIMKLAKVQKM